MPNLLWFSEISNEDKETCGKKGVLFGELYNIGLPIPQGFVVTADAYKDFIENSNINKQISNILTDLNLNDNRLMQKKADEINDIFLRAEFPEMLKDEILESYENLDIDKEVLNFGDKNALNLIKMGRNLPHVAIRTSNITDNKEKPVYLSVKGNNALLLNIKKCWASLFTLKSIYDRETNNLEHDKALNAVIIQRMINPYSSGIISTIENDIILKAVYGFPELIFNKSVSFNMYMVDKEDLSVKNKNTPRQEYMVTHEESLNKNMKRTVPEDKNYQVLEDDVILQLADFNNKIEKYYNKPVNVEFAIESGKIFIINANENI